MNPAESTVRKLLAAIDAGDFGVALELLTEDVNFRFGSSEPAVGHEAWASTGANLQTVVAGVSHDLSAVWVVEEPEPAVICEMAVTYERHDGSRLTLPCLNVFRLRDRRISDYRIYMDVNPVFAS